MSSSSEAPPPGGSEAPPPSQAAAAGPPPPKPIDPATPSILKAAVPMQEPRTDAAPAPPSSSSSSVPPPPPADKASSDPAAVAKPPTTQPTPRPEATKGPTAGFAPAAAKTPSVAPAVPPPPPAAAQPPKSTTTTAPASAPAPASGGGGSSSSNNNKDSNSDAAAKGDKPKPPSGIAQPAAKATPTDVPPPPDKASLPPPSVEPTTTGGGSAAKVDGAAKTAEPSAAPPAAKPAPAAKAAPTSASAPVKMSEDKAKKIAQLSSSVASSVGGPRPPSSSLSAGPPAPKDNKDVPMKDASAPSSTTTSSAKPIKKKTKEGTAGAGGDPAAKKVPPKKAKTSAPKPPKLSMRASKPPPSLGGAAASTAASSGPPPPVSKRSNFGSGPTGFRQSTAAAAAAAKAPSAPKSSPPTGLGSKPMASKPPPRASGPPASAAPLGSSAQPAGVAVNNGNGRPPVDAGGGGAGGAMSSQPAGPGPTLAEMDRMTVVKAPPPGVPGAPPQQAMGRELKVEDALLYLDQVKMEFGDRPRIYNEFLEIMKNFKAQEVDTIGVINRVRRLFHGYNNLILGFNTFLPDGFKIEMRDLEPVFTGPGLPGTNSTTPIPGYMGGRGAAGRGGMPGRGPPGGRGMVPPGGLGRGGRGMPPGRGGPMPGGRGGPPQLGPGGGRGMVPGGRGGAMPAAGGRGPLPAQGGAPGGAGGGMKPTPQQQQMMQAQGAKQKQAQAKSAKQNQQKQQAQKPPSQQASVAVAKTAASQQSQQQNIPTRTIEFDHAIMYVTNIKKRFANSPRIYHTFLEILHTYQKEQRGIKEVLEQVSSLFADHPDLLREFTFFLPDAVQEQAKERLSRAAAEAEAKMRAAAEAAAKHQQASMHVGNSGLDVDGGKMKSAPTGWRTTGGTPGKGKGGQGQQPMLPGGVSPQKFIDMTQPEEAGMDSPTRRPSMAASGQVKEDYVYNAGVERQFFDAVKAALTSFSRDGQAYAEFIKTLDMYAQEILSRSDMLGYVERLLGKHKDLFEEFKRIINAVGSPNAPAHDDSWHSVPLSEIDFSRCRRCSPSYRALPRDYPNPPCSERSEEEEKVLNDVWVSLPMGSEENNTFRHMRKNQYEETLFRCEDMRFEIDMCIDSNSSTLQRLIKINEELQFLSENESLFTKGGSIVKKSVCLDGAGLAGKVYQYTLDGRVLGVIHKHAIKRIYGDDGSEMLDLCFKNPAVALPIVVNRLRQKDEEWRAARDELNRKWKDISELNYFKSLDHRSITWRTTDKRATSTRAIVAEIKDREANNGVEGESAANARMDKMKEEHGTFYEITMKDSIPRKMDLTNYPKPTSTIFTPHMSFVYDNSSWAQQDAYRIISFALEKASISPSDKEQLFALWRNTLGPWFGLELSWMQNPATLFTPSPPEELHKIEADEDSADSSRENNGEDASRNGEDADMSSVEGQKNSDDAGIASAKPDIKVEDIIQPLSNNYAENGYFSCTNHVPFPPETLVSTTLGEGTIVQYLEEDGVYEISFPSSSTSFVKPDAVYASMEPVELSALTDKLRENDKEELERSDDQLLIGPQSVYLFFRLHQILIRRLNIAKELAYSVSHDTALGRHIEKITYDNDPDEGAKRYEAFLGLVYSLIDSGIGSETSDCGKFEDRVKSLLGNNAYELTTMDKLISHVLKHLQNCANDETALLLNEVHRRHKLAGSYKPSAYREEAGLFSEGENVYAFQLCNMPDEDKKILHCEFLGCLVEEGEEDDSPDNDDENDSKRGAGDMDDVDDSQAKRAKRAS